MLSLTLEHEGRPELEPHIKVTSWMPNKYPELMWANPSITNQTAPRRVAFLPLKLANVGAEPFVFPDRAANPSLYFKMSQPGWVGWSMNRAFNITLIDDAGDIARDIDMFVPFENMLPNETQFTIAPGQAAWPWSPTATFCLFDITGLGNGREFWVEVKFDPSNVTLGTAFLTFRVRMGSFEMRWLG